MTCSKRHLFKSQPNKYFGKGCWLLHHLLFKTYRMNTRICVDLLGWLVVCKCVVIFTPKFWGRWPNLRNMLQWGWIHYLVFFGRLGGSFESSCHLRLDEIYTVPDYRMFQVWNHKNSMVSNMFSGFHPNILGRISTHLDIHTVQPAMIHRRFLRVPISLIQDNPEAASMPSMFGPFKLETSWRSSVAWCVFGWFFCSILWMLLGNTRWPFSLHNSDIESLALEKIGTEEHVW